MPHEELLADMITRSTILHLRLPFSYVLLPVYLLALSAAVSVDLVRACGAFVVLHFLLYPAANGFNSFYDQDHGSIGMLERPPTVTPDLLWVSLSLNVAAVAAALVIDGLFATGCLAYALGAMAYSYPGIRFKRYPFIGWLLTGLGQGGLVFLMVVAAVQKSVPAEVDLKSLVLPAMAVAAMNLGFYPLTQVYQHKEDELRGFRTISLFVGIRGTFYLSSVFIMTGLILYSSCLVAGSGFGKIWMLLIMNIPAAVYFVFWFCAVARNATAADFRRATKLSVLAASGMNAFAVLVLLGKYDGWQFTFGV